jgi:DNA polymerase-3 subunit epsilon/oligoribonuclease
MYWAMTYSEHMGTKDYISLSKDSIARDLGLEPEDKPHRAMQGVKHLVKCYLYLMSNEPFFKGIK